MLVYRYPASFVDALVLALAAEIASPLSAKPELGTALKREYDEAVTSAGASDFRHSQEFNAVDSELITVRG